MTIENDSNARAVSQALGDTGYMARNLLGFDYDEDEKTGKRIRPGGIRPDGPHAKMVGLLDSDSRWKHLEAPRASYKTTLLKSYVVRKICEDRNNRVMWASATEPFAIKCVMSIRSMLEHNKRLIEAFGTFKESGLLWTKKAFTVSGRTDFSNTDPTVWSESVDTNFTGGHPNIIVLDDIVNWNNSSTPDAIEKIRRFFGMALPLLVPGGIIIVNGTRYFEDDLSGHILVNMKDQFEILVLDSGCEPQTTENGRIYLDGEPRFEHLTKEYLEKRLRGMAGDLRTNDIRDFQSQYNNRITGVGISEFRRSFFQSMRYEPWMRGMRAYVITDTATLEEERGCLSVVGVIGIDRNRVAYLFDLKAGHWQIYETVRNILDMNDAWRGKLDVNGICIEKTTMNNVFRAVLEQQARQRQMAIHLIGMPRGKAAPTKNQRIRGLSSRFANHDFVVMDSVPKFYDDMGRRELLWDKEGYTDEDTGLKLPAGELVNEFVRFPSYGKRDIADAIADIDMTDKDGNWLCPGGTRNPHKYGPGGSTAWVMQRINGRAQPVDLVPTGVSGGGKQSRWAKLAQRARNRA